MPGNVWIARSSLSNPQNTSEKWMEYICAIEEQIEVYSVKQPVT